jgi:hypothetical protein
MTETQLAPLWSDKRISEAFYECMPGDYYIDAIPMARTMRDEYEADRLRLVEQLAKIKAAALANNDALRIYAENSRLANIALAEANNRIAELEARGGQELDE